MMELNPQKIKAIVCDLDGTLLLPDAVLGDKTVDVIRACKTRGYKIILATGRSVFAAEKYRADMGLDGAMIYYNGAEVVQMPQGTILSCCLFDNEAALFCAKLAREHQVHFHLFFIDNNDASVEILMSENPSNAAVVYADRTGLNFQYGDLIKTLNQPNPPLCAKGLFIAESAKLEELRLILQKQFGSTLNIVKSAETFLEILNKDASKGNGLKYVLKFHGIKPEETLAFGDEENDISMLQFAGFSAAPANAKDSVKAAAKKVIGSHTEESVAAFLEEHFLRS